MSKTGLNDPCPFAIRYTGPIRGVLVGFDAEDLKDGREGAAGRVVS